MRLQVLPIAVVALLSVAQAQAPVPHDLNLRGDRFKPLSYAELTPEQKTMVEHLYAGERGGMGGPFNVTLRSPEMGDLAQKSGRATAVSLRANGQAEGTGDHPDGARLERAIRMVPRTPAWRYGPGSAKTQWMRLPPERGPRRWGRTKCRCTTSSRNCSRPDR